MYPASAGGYLTTGPPGKPRRNSGDCVSKDLSEKRPSELGGGGGRLKDETVQKRVQHLKSIPGRRTHRFAKTHRGLQRPWVENEFKLIPIPNPSNPSPATWPPAASPPLNPKPTDRTLLLC